MGTACVPTHMHPNTVCTIGIVSLMTLILGFAALPLL